MASHDQTDAMADALIAAGEMVKAHGSPALQTAMRLVLFTLGYELAEREARRAQEGGRPAGSADPFARIVGKRRG